MTRAFLVFSFLSFWDVAFADDFSKIKSQREQLKKNFEESVNGSDSENENSVNGEAVEEEKSPRIRVARKAPALEAHEPSSPDVTTDIQSNKPLLGTAPSNEPSPQMSPGGGNYVSKLSHAYVCFKMFLTAMFKARTQRDEHLIACAESGTNGCENQVAHENTDNVQTLGDQFRTCINQP